AAGVGDRAQRDLEAQLGLRVDIADVRGLAVAQRRGARHADHRSDPHRARQADHGLERRARGDVRPDHLKPSFHVRIAPSTLTGSPSAPRARAAAITAGSAERTNGLVARSSAIVDGVVGAARSARLLIASLSGSTAAAKRKFDAVYS